VTLIKGDPSTPASYAAWIVVAVLQAAQPFLKDAAVPPQSHPILADILWNYLPVILIGLVALLWVWLWLKSRKRKRELPIPSIDFPTPDWLEPLTPVIKKKYENETVELDGKWFHDCEFKDVTFLYNGTKDTQMTNCNKGGKLNFSSHNPLVSRTVQLVDSIRPAAGGVFEPFDGSAR
jgi:hypothetical protein